MFYDPLASLGAVSWQNFVSQQASNVFSFLGTMLAYDSHVAMDGPYGPDIPDGPGGHDGSSKHFTHNRILQLL